MLKVTLVRSIIGRLPSHVATIKGLGFTGKMHKSVELNKTPEILGMINKVRYMLQVEGE